VVSSQDQASGDTPGDAGGARRIVVGVDGSDESLVALEWAAGQAELTACSLAIVATWQWPTSLGWAPMSTGIDPVAQAKTVLEPILESVRARHPKVTASLRILEGHPAPLLVEESNGAELLVVGRRGHGEFVGMLIGSTSEYCVSHSSCPVVVCRGSN
jgi:nucleotide-binding universal stress UspA family protein